jgi:glycyl-tRNA synthetase beta chain
MVREFTELQGTMGGIYAREEGMPEEVWKAIYFHYLPVAVEADAPPTKAQLGKAAVTWAAVSLADKLDTIVGLFAAGEKPTGSRDPYALRRAAQGVVKILVDLPARKSLAELVEEAYGQFGRPAENAAWKPAVFEFLKERGAHLFERRGFKADEVRAVASFWMDPSSALKRVEALSHARKSKDFETLAVLFKRVKNITKDFDTPLTDELRGRLTEPAELALRAEIEARWPKIDSAVTHERYEDAMRELGALSAPVDRFFVDVLVMADDPAVRSARLALLTSLRRTILNIADISEIAPEEPRQA